MCSGRWSASKHTKLDETGPALSGPGFFSPQISAISAKCGQNLLARRAPAVTNVPMMVARFFIAVLVFAAAAFGARAQSVVENEYTTTEIIAEKEGFTPGETLWFAVRQELRPGWHVFWTNPGDAGMPLRLEWTLPPGFTVGAVLHPAPQYIPVGPLASYAHEGAPVFLVSVAAPLSAKIGDDISVTIHATWQACEEICVPEEGDFSFSLPVTASSAPNTAYADIFAEARRGLPADFRGNATFSVDRGMYVLEMTAPNDFSSEKAFFFAGPEGLVDAPGVQEMTISDGELRIAMKPGWVDSYDASKIDGVLTYAGVNGERHAVAITADVAGPITKPVASSVVKTNTPGLPLLLLFAFAGGVILNVMPCVFPIVFIKAASFVQSAQTNAAMVRRDGLFYSAGVLFTFLLMGGALLALRAGGEQFGWGFHLQSPAVVALSAYVLLLVGLNLSGVFSVGESVVGAGESLVSKSGAAGAFFTGALAVVVAAPCIGPLLSAPMGAALLLPPLAGLAIFAMLGLGLAAPYLALSFAPKLGELLPKPGAWMATFKQAIAFPVFAAAAYFVWVLAQQTGGAALGAVLAGAVLLAFSAWAFELSKGEGKGALILRALAAVAAVLALAPLMRIEARAPVPAEQAERYGAFDAVAYSQKTLAEYLDSGTPVFIDFTAAWCVTCQFDKMTVLSDKTLADAFEGAGAVFMVADWTVRDPEITEALTGFGASGVPLYVYYSGSGEPEVLPLPLTKKSVLNVISGARG